MNYTEKIAAEALSLGCKIERDAPLKERTTFKIGGKCPLLVHMNGEESFLRLIPLAEELGAPYYIFGKGSNLIVDSEGISGVVFLSGKDFSEIDVRGETLVCKAGAALSRVCTAALEQGLTGLEFAYGIPGTVGGAVFMNAGAYGGEMANVVSSVRAMDRRGNVKVYQNSELDFSYRHSRFTDSGEIVLTAEISLERGEKSAIKAKMEELMEKRRAKQPLEYPSAGSTFKRPEGNYAAALIEQCGLKGVHVGDAEVSEKHSGFVVNKGNASFGELMELIGLVKDAVREKTGYVLECEPLIISDKKED
ncbi:MAG: UDP-N-acetylmuramate dehydrogenase [Ruminococcus sp.]|nr:UDP-N-acetylmuramate dehydrogenase [Ruminococcus sp.]MCM1478677.1 UDP-N-acetylmuramate dehydrogenase [Muribaculaceae bacterium]